MFDFPEAESESFYNSTLFSVISTFVILVILQNFNLRFTGILNILQSR